jgi:multiple sugar transport system substrate-binding protein
MGIKKRTTFDERFELFNQDIREQIRNGTLQPGEFLVSEVKLAELYGISKNPVRRVLADLERDGLIEKIPCIGNRVCSQQQDAQPIYLTLMAYEVCYEIEVYQRAIALFEELHPGVKVKLEIVPNAIYAQRIEESLSGNDGADMILLSDQHYYQLDHSGHTRLLEEFPQAEYPIIAELYPQLLPMYESDGKLRAIPLTFSPVVYCCNKEIIPDPERLQLQDWSDLLEVARRHTIFDPNGLIRQYGLASTISFRRWLVFLLQNGGSVLDTNGRPILDHQACAEALAFFTELAHNNLLSPEAQGGFYADHFLFENNRVALMMSSYYFMNDLQQLPIRWDVVPFMPGNKSQSTLLIGSGIGIPKAGTKKSLARSFAELLASVEVQSLLKQNVCSIPAHRGIAENLDLYNPDIHPAHYHAFIGFMAQAVPLMKLGVDYGQLHQITRELIYLWSRMETAETVWNRIQERVLSPVSR